MEILKHSCIFCTINREGERIVSQAVFLSKEFEAQAQLIVDINHFKIIDAELEISKARDIPVEKRKALELIGHEAYFDINSVLGRLKAPDYDKHIKSLFFECVKGLIQAETYVFAERGFPGEPAYEDYWHEREKNGCRYYSQPSSYEPGWFEHVGHYKREGNLFNRCKNYRLIEHGSEWMAQGTFTDSFHEMTAEICFDKKTGITRKSELLVFRAPSSVCFENRMHGEMFVGKNFYAMDRKEITDTVGGTQGCYHLKDLVMDIADMVNGQRGNHAII